MFTIVISYYKSLVYIVILLRGSDLMLEVLTYDLVICKDSNDCLVLTHSLIFKGEAILEEPGTLIVVTAPPQPKCLVLIWNLRPEWSHKADGCRDEGKGKKYQSNQDPTRRHPHSRKCKHKKQNCDTTPRIESIYCVSLQIVTH